MKRCVKLLSVMLAVLTLIMSATPVSAETRYMSGTFKFGSYAPIVRIRHKVYTDWALQQQKNGTVSWCAKVYENRDLQLFVVIPTGDGYYSFRTVEAPFKFLTYNKPSRKFTMENPSVEPKYDWENYQPGDYQKFKIEWRKSGTTAKNITVKNFYRLRCKGIGDAITSFSGWSPFDLQQINAS